MRAYSPASAERKESSNGAGSDPPKRYLIQTSLKLRKCKFTIPNLHDRPADVFGELHSTVDGLQARPCQRDVRYRSIFVIVKRSNNSQM
jgi:hypothetical protein